MQKQLLVFISILVTVMTACRYNQPSLPEDLEAFSNLTETQLTFDEKGHFLHTTQYFSPDDQWIVYDTRNDGSHIGRTCCIEMVNTQNKNPIQLYRTVDQSEYGPGVGAVTFNPKESKVLFIHGLQNCDAAKPYGFSRRTGIVVQTDQPGKVFRMDGRDITSPFTPGALRGGTHAHTWSGDGRWISFTYNDAVMASLEKAGYPLVRDLRMVGVMAPYGPVLVNHDGSGENIDGEMFSMVVTRVTENPRFGSDQIDRAFSDGWVGIDGYVREDNTHQKRAVAFLGDTRNLKGDKLTEVFIVDIPDSLSKETKDAALTGSEMTRPGPPAGIVQRRLTYTARKLYPGVQGPRHWLRSSPDGSMIFFLMKDDQGVVQIFGISPMGGEVQQITSNPFSVETTFSVSPNGRFLAYGSGQLIYLTDTASGKTKCISQPAPQEMSELKSICWSNSGEMLACNRKVAIRDSSFFQIFLLK